MSRTIDGMFATRVSATGRGGRLKDLARTPSAHPASLVDLSPARVDARTKRWHLWQADMHSSCSRTLSSDIPMLVGAHDEDAADTGIDTMGAAEGGEGSRGAGRKINLEAANLETSHMLSVAPTSGGRLPGAQWT